MTFTIPTATELSDRLAGLDRLLTARRWERAAIVWAFTRDGVNQHDDAGAREVVHQFPVSVREFARLGFQGLGSQDSVRRYREAWQRAIEAGAATSVKPGETVDVPELEWPGTTTVADNPMRARHDDSPERKADVVERIAADPAVGRVLAQRARSRVTDDDVVDAHLKAIQAGGIVRSPSEVERERRANDPFRPVQEMATEERDAVRRFELAADALVAAGPFGPDSDRAERIRSAAMRAMDAIGSGART